MALRDRLRAEARTVDQAAGRAVRGTKEAVKQRIDRERYRRELKKSEQRSLRERAKSDLRRGAREYLGQQDVEPGTEAGDRLKQAGKRGLRGLVAGVAMDGGRVGQAAPDPRAAEEVRALEEAGMARAPSNHDLHPAKGVGTMDDYASGTRPSEGMQRYQQTKNNQTSLEWQAQHHDGAVTIVSAGKVDDGQWVINAVEIGAHGRKEGGMVVDHAASRQQAAEWALDWMEENPDGVPFHEKAGDAGPGAGVRQPPGDGGLVLGRRGAGGSEGYQQATDKRGEMVWKTSHGDGAVTMVIAFHDSGSWTVVATEEHHGQTADSVVVTRDAANKADARQVAREWMAEHPHGIPFMEGGGGAGGLDPGFGEGFGDMEGFATGGFGAGEPDERGRDDREGDEGGWLDFGDAEDLVFGGED